MVVEQMIEEAMRAFKEKLEWFCQSVPEEALSMESARVVTRAFQQAPSLPCGCVHPVREAPRQ